MVKAAYWLVGYILPEVYIFTAVVAAVVGTVCLVIGYAIRALRS